VRKVEIKGYGYYLPKKTVKFGDNTRYRASDGETQISMAVEASKIALKRAKAKIEDIDLIVSASAVGAQPIPCTAALIHEQLAKGMSIPAMDINSTCTSFITALDVVSYMIDAGRYKKVLLVASEMASVGLLPERKEIFELFSDGAAAVVLARSGRKSGVIAAMQKTWSESAHATEIPGGLTALSPTQITKENRGEYFFKMDGFKVLRTCVKKLPKMFEEFLAENEVSLDDIDLVIPHQASRALPMLMKRLKVPKEKYVNIVADYGNQVSVSVPFALCKMLEEGKVKKGDKILLCGTAAGLTSNILLMEL